MAEGEARAGARYIRAVATAAAVAGEKPSEDAAALLFTAEYRDRARFDHDAGRWFFWELDHWQGDRTGRAFDIIREIARGMDEHHPQKRAEIHRKNFAAGAEYMARSDRAHAVTSDAWDHDPWLLGCPGATVDLRTGETRSPDPADGITRRAAAAPAEAADCPRWLAFLREATGGDDDLVRFLRQWCGYCLTGDTREHALAFFYGPGGNGKSVFVETTAHVLGDYATTASMDTFHASNHDRHPTDLAMLRGARMVTASETEEGRAWAESRIKQLTGGDQITARFMRQDFFTYRPQFKLTLIGNHKPVLHNVDDAARRRFNIVPFTVTPTNPDKDLAAKLRAEAPGILRWMIEGCLDWQRNGLVRPKRVLDATAEYFDEQDLFGQWLAECCRVEPDNMHLTATPKALFESWSAYAHAAGERPGTQRALGNALTKRGLEKSYTRRDGRNARIWRGIELRTMEGQGWER